MSYRTKRNTSSPSSSLMSNLNRFITAQEKDYNTALQEIKNGKKITHWIWYIFPQIKGLGTSYTSNYYSIENLEEAKEYLNNEYLKNNLLEITKALLELDGYSAIDIFGYPDVYKVKSCMTLFFLADPSIKLFKQVLEKYYDNEEDINTIKLIKD